MDDVARPDGVVYRLIYRSRSVIPEQERRAELGRLFTAARSHNKQHGITGALLLLDDCFVQTLEGDEAEVQALLARIRADSRHDSLEVLETGLVDRRVFGRWSMAKVADEQDQPDPGIPNDELAQRGGRRGRRREHRLRLGRLFRPAGDRRFGAG